MANSKKPKVSGFKFKPFSQKALKLLTFWQKSSEVKDRFIVVADGSIRAGKTISMILSFVLWSMSTFNEQDFAVCGKSVGSFRRNCLSPLKQMMLTIGYEVIEHRSDNYIEIISGNVVNKYWIFGGKIFAPH